MIAGVNAWLLPRAPIAPVFTRHLSHDKDVLDLVHEDSLYNTDRLLNRTCHQIAIAAISIKKKMPTFKVPFIAMHGSADTITFPRGSQYLYDHAASVQKTLKIYPGLYHGIFVELHNEAVISDALGFLEGIEANGKSTLNR